MDLKKAIAGTVVGLTLGVGALGVAGPSIAGAAPTATTSTATAAMAKGHPKLRKIVRREGVKVAAKSIGISPSELEADIKAGQSIADVANAHNVSPDKVTQDLVTAGNNAIDKAVTAHELTPEQATKLKAKLPAAAQKAVNLHRKAK